MKLKNTVICISLSILIVSSIYAEEIYYWKDKDGAVNMSTTCPPDEVKKYETYKVQREKVEGIENNGKQVEIINGANEARSDSNQKAKNANEATDKLRKEAQEIRNKEAARLEAEAIKIATPSQKEILEKVEKLRAEKRNDEADRLEAELRKTASPEQEEMLEKAKKLRAGKD